MAEEEEGERDLLRYGSMHMNRLQRSLVSQASSSATQGTQEAERGALKVQGQPGWFRGLSLPRGCPPPFCPPPQVGALQGRR